MTQYSPQGYPQGAQRPRLDSKDFRHTHEIPALIITVIAAVIAMLIIGKVAGQLVGIVIPLLFTAVAIIFAGVTHKGHMVQVGPSQFPHLLKMAHEIADRLDMPVPEIYVKQSPVINAFALGVREHKHVVFHTALLENMSERELATVMAHEFGHLKCDHSLYLILQNHTAGNLLGVLIFMPLRWIFFYASRVKEYTADRAALLGTNDLQACITMQIKLAVGAPMYDQMNIQAYMQQMDDFSKASSSKLIEFLNDQSHPMTVNRILALIRYYRSPDYQRLAAANGRAGTSTLTSGDTGTRDLFQRVASQAEYERDIRVMQKGRSNGQSANNAAGSTDTRTAQRQSGMISCGSCGAPLETHARFCIRCGTPVAGAAQVGTSNSENSKSQPDVALPQAQVVRRVVRHGNSSQPLPSTAAEPPSLASATESHALPAQGPSAPVTASANTQKDVKTCTSCQASAAIDMKFCGNCGQVF